MRVKIPAGIPDPSDERAFEAAIIQALPRYIAQSHGRAFVLFTNGALMRRVAEQLKEQLEAMEFDLIVQGAGLPPQAMLKRFREYGAAARRQCVPRLFAPFGSAQIPPRRRAAHPHRER